MSSRQSPYRPSTIPRTGPRPRTISARLTACPSRWATSAAITSPIRNCGQPCRCCHTSAGTTDRAASPAPAQSDGRPKSPRGPHSSTATSRARQNTTIWNLICIATTTTAPAANSSRSRVTPSRRSRTQRTTSHVSSVHSGMSRAAVDSNRPSAPRARAWAAAVSHCARRSPPSSRASSAARTVPAPVATIAGSRSTRNEPGARVSASSASSGTPGGWSAYPQSRWRPAAMKYSSSPS